jgi:hypothetical protein
VKSARKAIGAAKSYQTAKLRFGNTSNDIWAKSPFFQDVGSKIRTGDVAPAMMARSGFARQPDSAADFS